jgi:hypothetical protein
VSPQAGLDVRNGCSGVEARARRADGARRIALNDQEVGQWTQQRHKRGFDQASVGIGVRFPRAAETDGAIALQSMLMWIERRMLAGQDQARAQAARAKRVGDGGKLDRFGPGADNQPYVCDMQPSP